MGWVMGCPLVVMGVQARGRARRQGVGAEGLGRCPCAVGRRSRLGGGGVRKR